MIDFFKKNGKGTFLNGTFFTILPFATIFLCLQPALNVHYKCDNCQKLVRAPLLLFEKKMEREHCPGTLVPQAVV